MADVGRVQLVLVGVVGGDAQEAGGDQVVAQGRRPLGRVPPVGQLVAGELLGQEAVEGQVGVEGADDLVAVAPLVLAELDGGGVVVAADDIDVAGGVEPVPAPALAEVRRGQQPVDQPLVGVGPRVGEERRPPPRARAAGRAGRSRGGGRGCSGRPRARAAGGSDRRASGRRRRAAAGGRGAGRPSARAAASAPRRGRRGAGREE